MEVMIVIKMVLVQQGERERQCKYRRQGGGRKKVLNLEFVFTLVAQI